MELSREFSDWLDARGEALPPCSCGLGKYRAASMSPPHEPDCERFIYADHLFFIFDAERQRAEQMRAMYLEHDADALSAARGCINGLILSMALIAFFALMFWAVTSALSP